MDVSFYILVAGAAFILGIASLQDIKERKVDSLLMLLFVFFGAVISFHVGEPSRAILALFFMVFGVIQRVVMYLTGMIAAVPWGDLLALCGLVMALPYKQFLFCIGFSIMLVLLGAARAYLYSKEKKVLLEYRVPYIPLLFAAAVLSFIFV